MDIPKAKVYHDGGHPIAIIPTTRPVRRKTKKSASSDVCTDNNMQTHCENKTTNKKVATAQLKDTFARLYKETASMSKVERNNKIIEGMREYFKDETQARLFVEEHIQKEKRNFAVRAQRLFRKARLQKWNYFCTFTYDDKKHPETTFRKSLLNTLRHFASRRNWKYIGVWEFSPKSNRLHFHCLLHIPDGQMVGQLQEVTDYDTQNKRMQVTLQNSHFLDRFGRNDFAIICEMELDRSLKYMMKYLYKSGERIVYSRNLPTFIVSDIDDYDVLCEYGTRGNKVIVADNFICMIDGEIIGEYCLGMADKMPTCN